LMPSKDRVEPVLECPAECFHVSGRTAFGCVVDDVT
jgi:hypothetical protein